MRRPCSCLWSLALSSALAACSDGSTGIENLPTRIVLSEDVVALSSFGETQQVTATVLDQDGSAVSGVAVAWSSSNTLVATVVDGSITAVGTGMATITAEAGGLTDFLTVSVQPPGAGASGPSFSQVVQEILVRRDCSSGVCHGGGAGYLALTFSVAGNYQNLVNVPSNAQPAALLVKPGDAAGSYLIMKLEGTGLGARMPLERAPLSATDLNAIKDWIDAGAANN
jgi:hypothetical protein